MSRYRVEIRNNLLTVVDTGQGHARPSKTPNKATRGDVRGFSARSRSRLQRLLAGLELGRHPWFASLTYREIPTVEESRVHLDRWGKALLKRDPKAAALWRAEWQQRGCVHFHAVIWAGSESDQLYGMADAWILASDQSGDPAAHLHAAEVEPAGNAEAVYWYLLGHHLKRDQSPCDTPGRPWGVIGRRNMPGREPEQVVPVSDRKLGLILRGLGEYLERQGVSKEVCQAVKAGRLNDVYIPSYLQRRLLEHVECVVLEDPF